jgi:hypothetical protein
MVGLSRQFALSLSSGELGSQMVFSGARPLSLVYY